MATTVLKLPPSLVKRLREKAESRGLSFEEYVLELLSSDLDPRERAREYIEAAMDLLKQAREELEKGGIRQAAEKLWGATALAVKAYAWWREGKRLASHGELWECMRRMAREIGKWIRDAFYAGHAMHTCFYEGWCNEEDVGEAFERIERLVRVVKDTVTTE